MWPLRRTRGGSGSTAFTGVRRRSSCWAGRRPPWVSCSGRKNLERASARLEPRDDVDLDGGILRELRDRNRRAGGPVVTEAPGVHRVHLAEFTHPEEVNGGLHDVVQ